MKIKIITTGGTIDKIYFDQKSEFQVGEPQIAEVLREANITLAYEVQPLLRKDSLDMTDEDRRLIYETIKSDDANPLITTYSPSKYSSLSVTKTMISGSTNISSKISDSEKFSSKIMNLISDVSFP